MKDSLMLRVVVIGLIVVGLLVPIMMIGFLVSEREHRRNEATGEIESMWSAPQLVSGPVLSVPYRCGPPLGPNVLTECNSRAHLQARTLTVEGVLEPEIRTRSVFRAVVYRARLKVRAVFAPDLAAWSPAPTEVFWDRASVNVGLSDPRGVVRISELLSGETRTKFAPGIAQMPGYALGFPTGMHAPAGVARPGPDGTYAVSFDFDLNGTRQIEFAMLGDEATVRLSSSWPHPSFIGGALPTTRTSTTEGFTAEWRTGAFWRAATAAGTGAAGVGNTFGVSLITPVDIYRQTDRAVKYAVLFIGATFLVAFLWEVTRGVLVHPVQYAFVGFSICVFYMLLLSGSEHAGFDPAYVVASAATVLLLSWYWRWVAGNRAQGGMMAVILSGMYGYLYLLLRLEDYALLAGSVGLFIALMLVMYLTRRVNWYRLGTTRQ